MKHRLTLLFVVVSQCVWMLAAQTPDRAHWVATWGASIQPFAVFAPPANPAAPAAPAPAPPPVISSFKNQTVRMIVPATLGGKQIRVHLSNTFSTTPLMIGSAHVAIHGKDSGIKEGSDRALTFSGQTSFRIPPGASIVSDPVALEVSPLTDLAISIYVPGEVESPSFHRNAVHTTYAGNGDTSGQSIIPDAVTTQAWYWISRVDVLAPPNAAAVVAFGDSITDGARSTPDTNRSWPSVFAARLRLDAATANIAVVNQGISGNRVLRDTVGSNALARFDRDVLSIPGAKWVIVLEGINDIGRGSGPNAAQADAVTTGDLIAGLRQLVERAHTNGIRVIGATLTPYEGAAYYSEAGETIRQAVNAWIRTGGAFDGVVDFDAATRDPMNPKRIRAEFDSGDHLHPGDAGYKAMADAIDLALFGSASTSKKTTPGKSPAEKVEKKDAAGTTSAGNSSASEKKGFKESLSSFRRAISR